MKKLYLLAACFLGMLSVRAQTATTANAYYFSYKSGVSPDSMTNATALLGPGLDDVSSSLISLPFSVTFAGISYQHFSVSSNGLMGLGTTIVNPHYYDYALVQSSTYPIITAFTEDFSTADNGGVSYKITGVAGSRKLMVQWKVKGFTEASNNYTKLLQVWIYEGSSNVKFVYGNGTTDYDNAAIGIAGTKSDYLAVNSVNNTASSSAGTLINNNFPVVKTCYGFNPTSPINQQIVVGTNGTKTNVTCFGKADGSITLGSISGGDREYVINWTSANGYTATGCNITNLKAGTYHYDVTDLSGSKPAAGDIIITEPTSTSTTITTSGPTSICQGSSVSLTAPLATSYLWSNGATTQTISVNTAGSYSVATTDAGGCKATSSPVTVNVLSAPSVSIAVADKNYLCSGLTLTATSTSAASYVWSNGATTAAISLTTSSADGVYNVKGTDANGCTSTLVNYNFIKQDVTGSYSLIGRTSISLGSGTTVAKGSVGVTGATGSISLGSNSSVAATGAVVKAKTITVSTPVNAPVRVLAPANLVLPAMQYNTVSAAGYTTYTASGTNVTLSSNYTSLLVKAGSTITLTGSIFGTVTIESGATVTFTNTAVNIDKLITSSSKATATAALATVKFAQGSAVKVSTSIYLYSRTRLNAEGNDVTFYLGDNNTDAETFTISGVDTKVAGTVYVAIGTIGVTSTDGTATTTNLNGMFIADKITSSGAKVIWGSANCTTGTTSAVATSANSAQADMLALVERTENKFKVYPSVTTGQFMVQLTKGAAKSSVTILDDHGRQITKQDVQANGTNTIQFNLSNQPAGIYLVKVISEKGEQTARVIIQR